MMVEMDDIPVESLVPEPLRALKGGDEYMARLPEFDADMEIKLREAEATGEVRRLRGRRMRRHKTSWEATGELGRAVRREGLREVGGCGRGAPPMLGWEA